MVWGTRSVVVCAATLSVVACLDAPPEALEDECVASLAMATLSSCVSLEDGTASCFGSDARGELGNDAELATSKDPVQVQGLYNIRQLRGGSYGFCAIGDDSKAWCWGKNDLARLGDGTEEDRPTPVLVAEMDDVIDIDLGGNHACALRQGGSVWCWGGNEFGELGDGGEVESSTTPLEVPIGPATHVVTSYGVSCAVLEGDEGVACWGLLGTAFSSPTPVVHPLTGVVSLSAHSHAVYAVRDDGTVSAWGANAYGQLGDGTITSRGEPGQVTGLTGATAVAGGGDHACAALGDGSVWCWGRNRYGQIGSPGEADSHTPVRVTGIPPAKAIAAGQEHTCITALDGTVHCWGNNCCSQLGAGSSSMAGAPRHAGVSCADGGGRY